MHLTVEVATTSSTTPPENLLEFADGEEIKPSDEEVIDIRRPSSPSSSIGTPHLNNSPRHRRTSRKNQTRKSLYVTTFHSPM